MLKEFGCHTPRSLHLPTEPASFLLIEPIAPRLVALVFGAGTAKNLSVPVMEPRMVLLVPWLLDEHDLDIVLIAILLAAGFADTSCAVIHWLLLWPAFLFWLLA
jgi:hypothetical protein